MAICRVIDSIIYWLFISQFTYFKILPIEKKRKKFSGPTIKEIKHKV